MKERNLKKYVDKWGKVPQVLVAVEEMSELTKELLKNVNRNKENREEIVQELADVVIMTEQLKIIYDIKESELDSVIDKKLDRLEKRINS